MKSQDGCCTALRRKWCLVTKGSARVNEVLLLKIKEDMFILMVVYENDRMSKKLVLPNLLRNLLIRF